MEGPHVYGPVHPVDGGDYAPLAGYHGGALSQADARLIAAAPEMLAALERIAAGDPGNHNFAALAIAEARAAIAKAEGNS